MIIKRCLTLFLMSLGCFLHSNEPAEPNNAGLTYNYIVPPSTSDHKNFKIIQWGQLYYYKTLTGKEYLDNTYQKELENTGLLVMDTSDIVVTQAQKKNGLNIELTVKIWSKDLRHLIFQPSLGTLFSRSYCGEIYKNIQLVSTSFLPAFSLLTVLTKHTGGTPTTCSHAFSKYILYLINVKEKEMVHRMELSSNALPKMSSDGKNLIVKELLMDTPFYKKINENGADNTFTYELQLPLEKSTRTLCLMQ